MKELQKHLILVAILVGLATVTIMMYPHSTSAASSSAVQVVPNNPFAKTGSNGSGFTCYHCSPILASPGGRDVESADRCDTFREQARGYS